MALLEVAGIGKSFGSTAVLRDISFDLQKGEALAIIGSSGSGKTTLLRCLNFLETADTGSITVAGETLWSADDARTQSEAVLRKKRLHFGLVFQNFNLFPHFSVLRNITEAPVRVLKRGKAEAKQNAMELLKKMGLETKADSYPCELSGGQQQRVSIARALTLNPDILFFDEPTSALDPELTGEILKVIKELAAEGMTMVVVTHEMSFARDVADHVIFMENGVIVEQNEPSVLFGENASDRVKQFLARFNR